MISLLINLFDVVVILHYFGRLLETGKKRNVFIIASVVIFTCLFTLFIVPELPYCNLVSLSIWTCIYLPAYKGSRRNKVVYALLLLAFAGFSQTLMYLINYCSSNAVYSFFIPHLVFYITLEIVARYQTIKGRSIDIKLLLILVSVPLISFISMPCMVLISEQMYEISRQREMKLLLPIALLILYMNVVVFYLYDIISSSYETKKQKEEYEKLIMWQRQYYETLSDNQNVIRKIKHDMQNNLQVVSSMIDDEEYGKAKEYLGELLKEQSRVNRVVSTGNDAIDTVLNIKFSLAEQLGIEVKKDINIPSMIPISYQDSIKIFGNLLDNSINALRNDNIEDRVIKWFMFYNANALVIQVSNPYIGKPVKYNKDSFWHGLGLDIVKTTVEKYNGTFDVSDDGSVFTVNILLYIDNYIESDK